MPHRLIEGLQRFQRDRFPHYREHYQRLVAEGQRPTTLFIGCCDSRVVPDLLTDARPGELFVTRNVGNFVPPFTPDADFHGTSAAIEFATVILEVTDIVVCGHTHCGAIRALYEGLPASTPHIARWLELGRDAMLAGELTEDLLRATEQRSIALQLSRLTTFPMVQERVADGTLSLHGWHYTIEEGSVAILDVASGEFRVDPS
ncbi:MAG TPA: carbonic anhydrase [Longimicrobiales bacterium]|nr:carbonic anhydrase [Longimicrobiales bacterium]